MASHIARNLRVVLVIAALGATAGSAAAVPGPAGLQARVSSTAADTAAARDASNPALAANTKANEYLAVWQSDAVGADNKYEIWARRVSLAGTPLGVAVRVSTTGLDTDPTRDATDPQVAYDAQSNEYLVVWQANPPSAAGKVEIFAQRLSALGALIGAPIQVSTTGAPGDTTRGAARPVVAYDTKADEYLVVWSADGLALDNKFEIFAQRLSGAGTTLGGVMQVSSTGSPGSASRDAYNPAVDYSPELDQYLVAWEADGLALDNKFEIFAQPVAGGGAPTGAAARISTTGSDLDATRDAFSPAVSHGSNPAEYLVAWRADSLGVDNKFEVFAERVGGAGAPTGSAIRLSRTGSDTDATQSALKPALAYNPLGNEFLASWRADTVLGGSKFEVFVSRIAADGTVLDANVQMSRTGLATDAFRDAFNGAIAYHPASNDFLVAWWADGLALDNKFEIFARRFVGGILPGVTPPPTVDTTPPIVRVRMLPGQRVLRTRALRVRISCNERCFATARGWVFIKKKPTRFITNRVTRQITPPRPVTVKLVLSRRAVISLRRALSNHRRVTMRVTVVAIDLANNSRRVRVFFRVRR